MPHLCFITGFKDCQREISSFLETIEPNISKNLVESLDSYLKNIEIRGLRNSSETSDERKTRKSSLKEQNLSKFRIRKKGEELKKRRRNILPHTNSKQESIHPQNLTFANAVENTRIISPYKYTSRLNIPKANSSLSNIQTYLDSPISSPPSKTTNAKATATDIDGGRSSNEDRESDQNVDSFLEGFEDCEDIGASSSFDTLDSYNRVDGPTIDEYGRSTEVVDDETRIRGAREGHIIDDNAGHDSGCKAFNKKSFTHRDVAFKNNITENVQLDDIGNSCRQLHGYDYTDDTNFRSSSITLKVPCVNKVSSSRAFESKDLSYVFDNDQNMFKSGVVEISREEIEKNGEILLEIADQNPQVKELLLELFELMDEEHVSDVDDDVDDGIFLED